MRGIGRWKCSLSHRIDKGWQKNAHGNNFLKAIAVYGRVFLGLSGESLIEYIYCTAIHANGFPENTPINREQLWLWCKRWAKCAEKYYYPYTPNELVEKRGSGLTNEQRQSDAMTRIADAVKDFEASGQAWPKRIRDRRALIAKLAHCSERTLAKPEYLPFWR